MTEQHSSCVVLGGAIAAPLAGIVVRAGAPFKPHSGVPSRAPFRARDFSQLQAKWQPEG
ncbi:MAG: hypothetical protein U0893_24580 [Chloroflexota bacterium]